jgi:hypothetical protein
MRVEKALESDNPQKMKYPLMMMMMDHHKDKDIQMHKIFSVFNVIPRTTFVSMMISPCSDTILEINSQDSSAKGFRWQVNGRASKLKRIMAVGRIICSEGKCTQEMVKFTKSPLPQPCHSFLIIYPHISRDMHL